MTNSDSNVSFEYLKRQKADLVQQLQPLKSGGGGGTYDGMDGWQTSVEARLGELKTEVRGLRDEARVDFRLLFAALIAVALGLAGLMAKGFHWI